MCLYSGLKYFDHIKKKNQQENVCLLNNVLNSSSFSRLSLNDDILLPLRSWFKDGLKKLSEVLPFVSVCLPVSVCLY